MSPPASSAVVVDHVSKSFRLPREQVHTLKERALHPFRRPQHDVLRALRDVSFTVQEGEFFGIVGRNGSGKSTLLKCLAGIYARDAGDIYINGRMSAFIELGVGFNPDLAAYDNVMLNATMLGLSPREARRRFDRVIDFAELHDFVDLKLKNYSSGMMVRLAFSVMIQVDAEILLIDEVLAVGDAAFQQKCFDEFGRIRRSGTTVLLVTHDMTAAERFCDRAMLLEHGRVVDVGETERVGSRYLELNFSQAARREEAAEAQQAEGAAPPDARETPEPPAPEEPAPEPVERYGDGKATILEAWFEDEDGERTEVLHLGRRCTYVIRARFHDRVEDPLFGATVWNSNRDHLIARNNVLDPPAGVFEPGDEVLVRWRFDCVLAPDRYTIEPAIAHSGGGLRWIDHPKNFTSIVVTGPRRYNALIDLPSELQVERRSTASRGERVG